MTETPSTQTTQSLQKILLFNKMFLFVMIPIVLVIEWALLRCMWGMAMGYRAPSTLGALLWGQLS